MIRGKNSHLSYLLMKAWAPENIKNCTFAHQNIVFIFTFRM